jgi:hypothetical protein
MVSVVERRVTMKAGWLMGLLLVATVPAHGQGRVTLDLDFEDGQVPTLQTSMEVPPQILSEGGDAFLRITGSPGDRDSIPASAPDANRSTVWVTAAYYNMPRLTDANRSQVYEADIRLWDAHGNDGAVLEWFQDGQGDESYGEHNGIGPAARFLVLDGRVIFLHCWDDERACASKDLGPVPVGDWRRYRLRAVWSDDPDEARLEVSIDGRVRYTGTGVPTNLGPGSTGLPGMKIGLYGDAAVGHVDFDNVWIMEEEEE